MSKQEHFPLDLVLSPTKDGQWELEDDFMYIPDLNKTDEAIVVLKGTKTDFASIPRLFWSLLPPWSNTYGKPAVVHDFLYRNPEERSVDKRKEADKLFLLAMEQNGTGWIKRRTIYRAVRLFGWSAWTVR